MLIALLVSLPMGIRAQTASDSPREPLRVAIAGLVHGHVDGFLSALAQHKDIELVGITDPDPALFAHYAQKYHLAPALYSANLETLIATRHPQALLVYTSIADHRPVIETAAAHGISVMVEKPLTISVADALAIRKAAREHHIQVLTNYETTWYASNKAAYQEVMNGRIGDIRRVVIHDGHQGPKEIGVGPEFMGFLNDPAKGGAGALYDFGCYGADLMTWLMKGETPLTVTAVLNRDKPALYAVDDDATVIVGYPKAQAVIQASWNWPFARKDMEVYGATGYAITVGPDRMRIRHEHDAEEQQSTAERLASPHGDSLSYLTAVLRGEIKPDGDLTALDTNVVVMQILDAARESARTGKTVHLAKLPQ
jgi:predicted dehydrogenase